MEEQRYGGPGRRNPDRAKYRAKRYPGRMRRCPPEFRQAYIESGWDCQPDFRCNWRVFARWIDEAGGPALIAERAAYVREHGRRMLHVHR